VRLIAADLGVAKNTAHRALQALTHAGIVAAEQPRTHEGRFRRGRYHLQIDGLIDRASQPARPTRRRPPPVATDGQLTLLTSA